MIKKIIIINIIIVVLVAILVFITDQKIANIVKNKEEVIKDITFEVYSNENNILKILVIAKDTENGINKLEYISEKGEEKEINGQGKSKVALDYEVKENGNYIFKAINGKGEEIQKTLTIDDEYRNNLIEVKVNTETKIATHGVVTIDYHGNESKKRMYKIGENGVWTNYNGEFEIDSYKIIDKNLQDLDTKDIKIYLKIEDDAKNIVQIEKKITNIDVDIAKIPQINILDVDKYPTITKDGIINHSTISIDYDNRRDITNYYSIDNGQNWIEYTENLNLTSATIIAKSIKNESGLEVLSEKQFINASASDALRPEAYDNDKETYIASPPWHDSVTLYFNVSSEVTGNYINFVGEAPWHGDGPTCWIYFLDKDGNELKSYRYDGYIDLNENLLCPEGCTRTKVVLKSADVALFVLREIKTIMKVF